MRSSCLPFLALLALTVTSDHAPAQFLSPAVASDANAAGAVRSDDRIAQGTSRQAAPVAPNPASGNGGWLGARIRSVTQDVADGLGLKMPAGVLVENVFPESPACRGGLRRGDVILKTDGVDVGEARAFAQMIGQKAAGRSVDLVILRKGAQQSLTVALELNPRKVVSSVQELPARPDDVDLNPLLGIVVELLSDEARSGHGIAEHVSGVVITKVQPTQKLLKIRDVVVEVDQVAVTTPDQLTRRVNAVRRTGRKSVLLTTAAPHGETRYVAVSFSATAPPAKTEEGAPLKELPLLERLEKLR
jgi:S1-C subfamily serine protease